MSSNASADPSPARLLAIALGAGVLVLGALLWGRSGPVEPDASPGSHVPGPPSGQVAVDPPDDPESPPEPSPVAAQPVVPPADDSPLEAHTKRPAAGDGPRWELVVRVLRPDGSPATDAVVLVAPRRMFAGEWHGPVDESGEQRFQAINRSEVVVHAWDDSGDAAVVQHRIVQAPTQSVEMHLERGRMLAAAVYGRGEGGAAAGRLQDLRTKVFDAHVTFAPSGANRLSVVLDASPGRPEPGGTVVGRCTTEDGTPLRGVSLHAHRGAHAISGADGRFEIEPVPRDDPELIAMFDGRVAVRVSAIGLEEWSDVGDVVLASGGELAGRIQILGKQRRPLVAWLWNIDLATFVNKVNIAADDTFSFTGVGPGAHGVAIAPWKEHPRSSDVHGEWAEGTAGVVVPYQPLLALEVELVSAADGDPVEVGKATVRIRRAGTTEVIGATVWEGDPFSRGQVSHLAPGRVDVDVLVPGYRTARVDGVEIVDGEPAHVRVPLTPLTR